MARKPKGFSELLGQQRQKQSRQAIERSYDELEADLINITGQETTVLREPAGMAKMSEVLEKFVEPYQVDNATEQELQNLFSMGVVAWNLGIMPQSERSPIIDKFFADVVKVQDPELVEEGKELLQEMIDRKERHFADNTRIIANFKLQYMRPGHFSISVASMMSKPE
jgi:hypothetical protein